MKDFETSLSLIKEMRVDEAFILGGNVNTIMGQPHTKETLKILHTDTPLITLPYGFCKKEYTRFEKVDNNFDIYHLNFIKDDILHKYDKLTYALSLSKLVFSDHLDPERYPEFYYYAKEVMTSDGGGFVDFGDNKVFICKSLFRLRKKETLSLEVYRISKNLNAYKFTLKQKNYVLDTYFFGIIL